MKLDYEINRRDWLFGLRVEYGKGWAELCFGLGPLWIVVYWE